MAHGQELQRLYAKLNDKNPAPLPVPRVITIYQQCVKHNIQDTLIKRLHFNDLYVLLMSLDISDIKQVLKQKRKEVQRKHGIGEIKNLSADGAVKFLKGGGF